MDNPLNPQAIFLVMVCIGVPIFVGMAILMFVVASRVKKHGERILKDGVERAGSRGFGAPSEDRYLKS